METFPVTIAEEVDPRIAKSYKRSTYLGDTLHIWAVLQACALQRGLRFSLRSWDVLEKQYPLFEGSAFPIGTTTEGIEMPFIRRSRWCGPRHGEHVRDTMAAHSPFNHLDLKIKLPIAQTRNPKRYAVLCPQSASSKKHWMLQNPTPWSLLARQLEYLGLEVFVNIDEDLKPRFLDSGYFEGTKVRAIWPSLKEFAFLLRDAAVVIGVDGGHLHLADAMGNAPVGVYAVTSPVTYGPYCDSRFCIDRHEQSFLQDVSYNTARFNAPEAMEKVTVNEVWFKTMARLIQPDNVSLALDFSRNIFDSWSS